MAYELTEEEAQEGRSLLYEDDTEAFFLWADDKLVINHDAFRDALGKCIRAGDKGRAE